MRSGPERALVVLGALAGCLGVALSAAAAHVPAGATLETSARFLLLHAPVLVALPGLCWAGLVHRPLGLGAGFLLALGLLLFSGDLAFRALRGVALFPMAAPAGGIVLMGGWAVTAAAAVIGGRSRP